MKLKIIAVDFEIPAKVKLGLLRVGLPLAILIGASVVTYASVPKTWTAGEVLKSADLNSEFASLDARITTLETAAHPPSAFHAWMTMPTSVPDTGAPVAPLIFDHVDYDLGGEYTSATGTLTPKNAGTYLVSCALYFACSVTGGIYAPVVFQNATQVSTGAVPGTQGLAIQPQTAHQVRLAAGDTVACGAFSELTERDGRAPLSISRPHLLHELFAVARLY